MLLDPETKAPFYVGKGRGKRAKSHLWISLQEKYEAKLRLGGKHDRKMDKIREIRSRGLEPELSIVLNDISSEDDAYDAEELLILKYGRRGFEENGILLNICLGAKPPNHAGRSYEEIYGSEASNQIEKRRQLQLVRGGYGPSKHLEETRTKISKGLLNNQNALGHRHSPETIELMRSPDRPGRALPPSEKQLNAWKEQGNKRRGISVPQGKWYTNGQKAIRCLGPPPEGFRPGRR